MVLPITRDDGRSEGPRRIHARPGVFDLRRRNKSREEEEEDFACGTTAFTYGHHVTDGDGQPDGEGDGALYVGSLLIAHGLNNQDEEEGDERLDEHGLQGSHQVADGSHAEGADDLAGSEHLQNERTPDCADALHDDVEDALEDTHVASDEEPAGHGGVNMTPADVSDRLQRKMRLNVGSSEPPRTGAATSALADPQMEGPSCSDSTAFRRRGIPDRPWGRGMSNKIPFGANFGENASKR